MNLFFGLTNEFFYSNLAIPKFSYQNVFFKNPLLCKLNIVNNRWNLNLISEVKNDENFYYLGEKDIKNEDIFFLASKEQLKNFDETKIVNLQNFTSQKNYRSSLTVFNRLSNGFSSYQSEYPFSMTFGKGSIISTISLVTNKNCNNYLILKNILNKPVVDNFNAFIVNFKSKKVIDTFTLKTNYTNFIKLNEDHIEEDNYVVTEKYLSIPIYISENEGHISIEHTNPTVSNLLDNDRRERSSNLKTKLNEIIAKKNFN